MRRILSTALVGLALAGVGCTSNPSTTTTTTTSTTAPVTKSSTTTTTTTVTSSPAVGASASPSATASGMASSPAASASGSPGAVAADIPSTYQTYTAPDGSFTFEAPYAVSLKEEKGADGTNKVNASTPDGMPVGMGVGYLEKKNADAKVVADAIGKGMKNPERDQGTIGGLPAERVAGVDSDGDYTGYAVISTTDRLYIVAASVKKGVDMKTASPHVKHFFDTLKIKGTPSSGSGKAGSGDASPGAAGSPAAESEEESK